VNKDLALAVLVGLFFLPLLLLPLVSQEELGGPLSFPPIGSGSFRTYVVRSGDTLAGLADRYGVPLSWLVASNGLLAGTDTAVHSSAHNGQGRTMIRKSGI